MNAYLKNNTKVFSRILEIIKAYPDMIAMIISGIVAGILWFAPSYGHNISLGIIVLVAVWTDVDVARDVIDSVRKGNWGSDLLAFISIATTALVHEFWAAWVVCLMVRSGEVIETFAQRQAQNGLSVLVAAAPATANVAVEDSAALQATASIDFDAIKWETVTVDSVPIGRTVMVRPGETVPLDGVVLSRYATVDLSMINGEPILQKLQRGEQVLSGSINTSHALVMRVLHVSGDSQYQRIVDLVQSARESKSASVRIADRLAVPFTVLSLVIGFIAWAASGDSLRFAQVLVLATPCPLLISAPVAFMGGTNVLARAGIVVKSQETVEQLSCITDAFFDKTGTLTVKKPQVSRLELVPDWDWSGVQNLLHTGHIGDESDWLLQAAGAVEAYSVHILAQGISSAAAAHSPDARPILTASDVHEASGRGMEGCVQGHIIKIGRIGYILDDLTAQNIDIAAIFPAAARDEMVSYVSVDGRLAARLILRDIARDNAEETIVALRHAGVQRISMLTGDRNEAAQRIAQSVGITSVYSQLLPQDKFDIVSSAKRNNPRATTMMIGDGVNDAPVLAAADVGVAITGGSSTAASESAQAVVMNDNIYAVAEAVHIAQRTIRIMLQAVIGGLAVAVILMCVAASGIIPAVVGAFLQEVIDVGSILWALRAAFGVSHKKQHAELQ